MVRNILEANANDAGELKDFFAQKGILVLNLMSSPGAGKTTLLERTLTDLRPELPAITAPAEVLYVTFNYPGMTPEMTDGIYAASFAGLPGVTLTRIDDSASMRSMITLVGHTQQQLQQETQSLVRALRSPGVRAMRLTSSRKAEP